MEHIEPNRSLESELQMVSICSIRIRSRNRDIVEKLRQNTGKQSYFVCLCQIVLSFDIYHLSLIIFQIEQNGCPNRAK